MGRSLLWTDELFQEISLIFANSLTIHEAVNKVNTELGMDISYKGITRAFNRRGYAAPASLLSSSVVKNKQKVEDAYENKSLEEFVQFANKRKYTFTELCNLLDISPMRLEKFIKMSEDVGYKLNITNSDITINKTVESLNNNTTIKMPVRDGNKIRFGVISDTHFGSKAALPEYVKSFVDMAYNTYNVKTIIHCGDILTGNSVYKGQVAELTSWGCQAQCEDACNAMPAYKDLQYYILLGNHDLDFVKRSGIDPGFVLSNMRKDFNILGNLKATFEIANTGLKVEVLHIKSKAHAKSYALEKHIAQTVSKINCPDLVFCGHRHTGSYFVLNQMHCFMVPCFEDANMFVDYHDFIPTIGGIIVELVLNKDKQIVKCIPIFDLYNQKVSATKSTTI